MSVSLQAFIETINPALSIDGMMNELMDSYAPFSTSKLIQASSRLPEPGDFERRDRQCFDTHDFAPPADGMFAIMDYGGLDFSEIIEEYYDIIDPLQQKAIDDILEKSDPGDEIYDFF